MILLREILSRYPPTLLIGNAVGVDEKVMVECSDQIAHHAVLVFLKDLLSFFHSRLHVFNLFVYEQALYPVIQRSVDIILGSDVLRRGVVGPVNGHNVIKVEKLIRGELLNLFTELISGIPFPFVRFFLLPRQEFIQKWFEVFINVFRPAIEDFVWELIHGRYKLPPVLSGKYDHEGREVLGDDLELQERPEKLIRGFIDFGGVIIINVQRFKNVVVAHGYFFALRALFQFRISLIGCRRLDLLGRDRFQIFDVLAVKVKFRPAFCTGQRLREHQTGDVDVV